MYLSIYLSKNIYIHTYNVYYIRFLHEFLGLLVFRLSELLKGSGS